MLLAIILICVGGIVLAAPAPAPWANWVALTLFVLALIVACIRHTGAVW